MGVHLADRLQGMEPIRGEIRRCGLKKTARTLRYHKRGKGGVRGDARLLNLRGEGRIGGERQLQYPARTEH